MHKAIIALLIITPALIPATTVLAQPAPSKGEMAHALCDSPDASPDDTIAGCSALIKAKAVEGSELGDTYNNRADGYLAKKKYDLAIADEDKAVALNPGNPNALNNRCLAYIGKKQAQKAIADCSGAIKLNPGFGHYYRNRASAYLLLGKRAEALADVKTAVTYDPTDQIAKTLMMGFIAKMDQGGAHIVDDKHPAPPALAARLGSGDGTAPPAADKKSKGAAAH